MVRGHVVGSLVVLVLAGCGGSDEPTTSTTTTTTMPSPTIASATPTPTPTATTPSPEPVGELLDYETADEDGATLTTPDDVAKLTGAPDDFEAFIAAELAREQATGDESCTQKPQIYVSRIDTGGWAAGGHFIPQCGGYASLWARPGGTWKEVWGGHQLTDCATLEKYDFPVAVAGPTCLDGETSVPYTD